MTTVQTSAQYTLQRQEHWNKVAIQYDRSRLPGRFYHRRIEEIYRFLVPPGASVLELGCGTGDLLAALHPATGLGIDFSPEMIACARTRHPNLSFECADAHFFECNQRFDYVLFSDLVNELWDVQAVLEYVQRVTHPGTRLVFNMYSRVWSPLLGLCQALGWAVPQLQQNWLTVPDLRNLLHISGFDTLRSWQEVLFPLPLPILAPFLNRILVKLWPFNQFALTNFVVARPSPAATAAVKPLVSVVVPARNEEGNIEQIFERVPEMGAGTELVFVEGHSRDHTRAAIAACLARFPHRRARLLPQDGIGKGDAVRKGFEHAAGEILMILDADLTVAPEDLPRFFDALVHGKGELINGVRLVYPMQRQAMRFFNLVGNRFFGLAFSWLLGQPVKDTLCGTKALWKKDYEAIAANRTFFGEFDPFGDYDLLFGAARLNRKIIDMPIRYRERTYGTTNIHRWRHGWLLIRMIAFAAKRMKFI